MSVDPRPDSGANRVTVDDIAGIFYDPERPASDDRSVDAIRWRVEHDYDLEGRNQAEDDVGALLAEVERLREALEGIFEIARLWSGPGPSLPRAIRKHVEDALNDGGDR